MSVMYDLRDNILYFAEEHDREMTEDEALDIIAGYERREIEETLDHIATDEINDYDPPVQRRICGILDDIRAVLDDIDWDPPEDWTW